MRKSVLTLWAAAAGLPLVSCAGKVTPVPTSTPGAELRLESITPQDGAVIGFGTLLQADLVYTIADFEPGAYRIFTQFETGDPEVTSGDDAGGCTDIPAASGRCELRFPMDVVWNRAEVKRPFAVWFYLTRRTSVGASIVVARAGPVRFRTQ